MPFQSGTKLPGEAASKLGHLTVTKSEWVKSLIDNFESIEPSNIDASGTIWQKFDGSAVVPLSNVWATDGSYVLVKTEGKPQKEVCFVKTALLSIDRIKLEAIDSEHPHPLLLQDVMKNSAVFHATVFPMKNVKTELGSNYSAVRHIVNESIKIDEDGAFYKTLKWLVYKEWSGSNPNSPSFDCPHCNSRFEHGLPNGSDEGICSNSNCQGVVFLTDMIGFHLDMDEESAPDSVVSSYMLIMETLMLFTAVRLFWEHSDKALLSNTLFIKDGPLTLRSQYSKLVPPIREFLQFAKNSDRPAHIIGQEKSGVFFDHLSGIVKFTKPDTIGDKPHYSVLSHDYVRREVYRSPDLSNPYGSRTNWGEKVYVKLEPSTHMVLSIPTGEYNSSGSFPAENDLIGLKRIMATLPSLVSRKYEGALYPVELANGIASMSSYPSAKILQRFAEDNK